MRFPLAFPLPAARRHAPIAGLLVIAAAAAFVAGAFSSPTRAASAAKRLLVVTVTKGFRHDSIPTAEATLQAMAARSGGAFMVDFVRDDAEMARKMTAAALKGYDGVFFVNTTGELPLPDRDAFLRWIAEGRGFVGAHAATDTFHGYEPYVRMIGAEFKTHGAQSEVECRIEDPKHPATRPFAPARSFKVFDEIYQFTNFDRGRVRGLLTLDQHPNTGAPGDYPIAWCRNEGKGRVFYTALGHRKELWEARWYQDHLLGGIRWALGLEKGDAAPQKPGSELEAKERREGFRSVFNGRDLAGWKLRRPDGKASWSVQNGMLVNVGGGTDLVSDERFGDHVVRYEYLVPRGGNSGFYLRGRYEVQVSDDFESKTPTKTGNGAVYGKVAPSAFASRPAGQWQQVEATVIGNRVSVVLNGTRVIADAPIEGVCGLALDDRVTEPGPILLQGDHTAVAFRNLRVKVLRATVSPFAAPTAAAARR